MPAVKRACPICSTVSFDTYCPRCRPMKIIVRTLTIGELRVRLRRTAGSADLIRKSIAALEGMQP
jgi:hypothetical protein